MLCFSSVRIFVVCCFSEQTNIMLTLSSEHTHWEREREGITETHRNEHFRSLYLYFVYRLEFNANTKHKVKSIKKAIRFDFHAFIDFVQSKEKDFLEWPWIAGTKNANIYIFRDLQLSKHELFLLNRLLSLWSQHSKPDMETICQSRAY